MARRFLTLLLVLVLFQIAGSAQVVTFPAPQLPVSLAVTWDDDTSASPPTTYEVSLDGGPPISVPAVPVPCVECAEATVSVQTAGLHTIAVRGRNSAGLSDPAMLEVTITFLVTVSRPPTLLRLVRPGTAPVASVPGTQVPPSLNVTASDLSVWTLSDPLPNAATVCPGAQAAQCRAVIINGAIVPGANAYELFVAADGAVWVHTYSGMWYRAGSSVGQATKPQD